MDGWAGPEELLRDAPTWAPSPAELADLELLLAGAYAPLRGFLGASDVASLRNSGHLTDGTDWPVPVTLEIPVPVAAMIDPGDPTRRTLVLTDAEGAPIVRAACTIWASCGRSNGRSTITPSTRPSPSAERT